MRRVTILLTEKRSQEMFGRFWPLSNLQQEESAPGKYMNDTYYSASIILGKLCNK